MAEAPHVVRPARLLGLPLVAWLTLAVAVLVVLGALFVVAASRTAPPLFPAAPPGAQRMWASQTTDMLEGNQILSLALYRVAGPPGATIAYYQRALPAHGGTVGRFADVIVTGSSAALPTALQHLPRTFADGRGLAPRARYTYTGYSSGGNDIGIAVDLRHAGGPTLVFVEMLSS